MKKINDLRKEIDNLDKILVESFEKRMKISKEISNLKNKHNLSITDKTREIQKIKQNNEYLKNKSIIKYTESFTKELIKQSKKYQKALKKK